MRFKKFLSFALLGASFMNNADVKTKGCDETGYLVAGTIVAATAVVLGVYIHKKHKKEKEIERRKKAVYDLSTGLTKAIAEKLIGEFPFTEQGKTIFDNLIKCTGYVDMMSWAGIDVANSGWSSETLNRINNVLRANLVFSDILQRQISITRKNEIREEENKALAQRHLTSSVGMTWDLKDGIKPVFMF